MVEVMVESDGWWRFGGVIDGMIDLDVDGDWMAKDDGGIDDVAGGAEQMDWSKQAVKMERSKRKTSGYLSVKIV